MNAGTSPLPKTQAAIEDGMRQGWHIGAQAYVSLHGQPGAELALGEIRPGAAMRADSIPLWMSSTKPVGAVAILRLWERGQIDLDDPVARYIPEFGQQGKQAVTVQHLLTHTGGFRLIHIGWPERGWDEIIASICAGKLERGWMPGQRAGYHPYTSWYILGELVRRIDGRDFSHYARQEIFEPLGMRDSWIGMPVEQYRAYGDRLALMPNTEKPGLPPHRYCSEQGATDCVPGGNGYGPMRELGRFYEMLLAGGELDGARILQAATVECMTSRVREGMFDETFKHVMDWGLGVVVNSNRYGVDTVPYGYGRYASDAAFGHSGAQSSVAFADPAHGLVVALFLNGTPGEKLHDARMRSINAAIYEDVGLAPLSAERGMRSAE